MIHLSPRLLAALLLAPALASGAVPVAAKPIALTTAVPRRGDHTLLSWREGPPYFTNSRYSSERRVLRLETGFFAADFDTEHVAITGFARAPSPRDEATATRSALAAAPLPPAQLHLSIRVGDTLYACAGRRPLSLDHHGMPASPLEFPVRLIEGGRFFQKFSLHDLEFRAASGRRLPAAARLEISAWPDRLALTLIVRPEEELAAAQAYLRLQTDGGIDASRAEDPDTWPADRDRHAILTLSADGSARVPTAPAGITVQAAGAADQLSAAVRWNPEELCHTLQLIGPDWPLPTEGHYPESLLDAWESYGVTLENRTSEPHRLALKFAHTPAKSITGFVPMIGDDHDFPAGIPVQISKNWHTVRPGVELPHAGPWMHGRTWLHLAPHSRVSFRYGTTFARWGGVPTASLAQLSLVGWGHNGFWDQFALGAFGESFCFQPARVMRRALLTDFRPLFQRGFSHDDRWAWSGNVGGGDTLVRLDPRGHYVPFQRNVTRYASHGPNLAHLIYEERSVDDAIRSRVEVLLPRSDDHVRVYVRLHAEVAQRVEFSRLSLFQLGADYYNEPAAPQIAWGHADGLGAEHRPTPEAGARLLPAWEARGAAPWISLHGETRADSARTGQSTRGLIVREWRAVLGGRPVPAPFFAAVGSRGSKSRLAAEIIPPPGLTTLERGDQVDLLVEIVALPLAAERYYGPDHAFQSALAAHANTWRLVHREAADNHPGLTLPDGTEAAGWPLAVAAGADPEIAFTLHGGLGYVPVRLTGLAQPQMELFRVTRSGRERVVQGVADRAYWQSDYDSAGQTWTLTYNLPATALPTRYVAVRRVPEPVTMPVEPGAVGRTP